MEIERKTIYRKITSEIHVVNALEDSAKVKENPVIPGDFADPSSTGRAIRIMHRHFIRIGASLSVVSFNRLVVPAADRYVLSKTPSWASASFWRPNFFITTETTISITSPGKKAMVSRVSVRRPPKILQKVLLIMYLNGVGEPIDPIVIEDGANYTLPRKLMG